MSAFLIRNKILNADLTPAEAYAQHDLATLQKVFSQTLDPDFRDAHGRAIIHEAARFDDAACIAWLRDEERFIAVYDVARLVADSFTRSSTSSGERTMRSAMPSTYTP